MSATVKNTAQNSMSTYDILKSMYGKEKDGVKTLNTEKFVFVTANFSGWSGKVSAKPDQVGSSDADKILTVQQKVCPKELLQPFKNIRTTTFNNLDRVGARFRPLGANTWVVCEESLPEVKRIFLEAQDRFNAHRVCFSQAYDKACEDYFVGKEHEALLRSSKMACSDILDKYEFQHSCFQMGENSSLSNADVFDSFAESIAMQSQQILNNLSKRADESVLSAKSLAPLFDLQKKAEEFSFISPHADAVANFIRNKLLNVTPGQEITDANLIADVVLIVTVLSVPASVHTFGDILQTQRLDFGGESDELPDLVIDSIDATRILDSIPPQVNLPSGSEQNLQHAVENQIQLPMDVILPTLPPLD